MSFSLILSHEKTLGRLRRLLATRRVPPALLFHGPEGVGKARVALEFAKALNCEGSPGKHDGCDACDSCAAADKNIHADIHRLNAAYQASLLDEEVEKQGRVRVDTVRHLIKDLEMRSFAGRWKVGIIEDAHQMVPEAQNALLKALEEPAPRTAWILVSSQKELLLPTVLSRCHPFPFGSLPPSAVETILRAREISVQDARRLMEIAEGSPGKALELWRRRVPELEPAAWLSDPLGPLRAADKLPRELHLARALAEDFLHRAAWHARSHRGSANALPRPLARALRSLLGDFNRLRQQLKSNADPRLVVELGALRLQDFLRAPQAS